MIKTGFVINFMPRTKEETYQDCIIELICIIYSRATYTIENDNVSFEFIIARC